MSSYETKVYKKQGGDELVVESGGTITVKSGGTLNIESGAAVKAGGTQASAITSLTDSSTGTATNTIAAATNTDALTDSTTGTPGNTLVDAGGSYTQANLNNNFASIAAELATQRSLNTVLVNAIASLAAKDNAVLAALRGAGIIATA